MTDISAPGAAARAHYDQAAAAAPEFSLMSYGFPAPGEHTVVPAPEYYCPRQYEHAVRGASLDGRDVLEVSCGRGGGGAAFLTAAFRPRRYAGVDLSSENIRIARQNHRDPKLEFAVGRAESLDSLRDWSGVSGYRAFRRFESGETLCFSHLLERPRA